MHIDCIDDIKELNAEMIRSCLLTHRCLVNVRLMETSVNKQQDVLLLPHEVPMYIVHLTLRTRDGILC